jgi:hypothetical protein
MGNPYDGELDYELAEIIGQFAVVPRTSFLDYFFSGCGGCC